MSDNVEITPAIHRQIGIATFNETWSLFESDPTDALLHAAHASAYHWRPVAEPVNLVRSDWLLARAYTVKGWSEPALHYAERALRLCEENGIGDFDLAYAYEGLARAYALAGEREIAAALKITAADHGTRIAESEDRELFESDLGAEPWFGV